MMTADRPERRGGSPRRLWRTALAAALLVVLAGVVWFGSHAVRSDLPRTLTIYCFSGLRPVMEREILPAFREDWAERTGGRVEFITAYAGSGTITDRIVKRFPAEVAILASEMDAYRLVENGAVPGPVWRREPRHGVIGRSPMVILTRPGNPKGIEGFGDLGRPGIALVQPDPLTSGAGEWALLALWAAAVGGGGGEEAAVDLFRAVRRNTAVPAPNAPEARALFAAGEGDALITYESEALLAARDSAAVEIIRPAPTVVAEAVAIALDKNVSPPQRDLARGFLSFLRGARAQSIFAAAGFRAADEERNAGNPAFAAVEGAVGLDDLGGPESARKRILGEAWEKSASPPER